ncbi:DMT family transporter [Bacillus sp. ISL-46]|uniref:DMT family transporter n=1 Tax=Bacillus sp. ISL-46 TaxID=2819129 RepID=UPI001BE7ADEF|nr:DMT family transporter [Bacillus sp. ISL-46]MBT2724950.1 DMT family transporter [Bacillus sp. ISL-46]
MSNQTKANIMMVIVNIFWGSSYVFMKIGLMSLQTFNIISLRFLIAFIITGFLFYKRIMKVTKQAIISSFILGFALFGVFTFITFGVSMTSASNSGFLVSLTVIFVPLINCVLIKRLPPWTIRVGLVFTLTGIGLLTIEHSFSINLGDLLCIIGAFCYAIHIILTGKLTKQNDALTLGILQLGFAGLLAMICSFVFENPSLPSSLNPWIAIIGLGIFCSAVGFVCQSIAQKYTTSTHIGLIFALEPIFAALFAVLLFGEVFTFRDFIGCCIVILGILISQIDKESLSKIKLYFNNQYSRRNGEDNTK